MRACGALGGYPRDPFRRSTTYLVLLLFATLILLILLVLVLLLVLLLCPEQLVLVLDLVADVFGALCVAVAQARALGLLELTRPVLETTNGGGKR